MLLWSRVPALPCGPRQGAGPLFPSEVGTKSLLLQKGCGEDGGFKGPQCIRRKEAQPGVVAVTLVH